MPRIFFPSQAVILAAGINSRFVPFNSRNYHKSNFLLMGEPIIRQTVGVIKKAGIKEVVVITSPKDKMTKKSLENLGGKGIGLDFYTQKQPLGIASALLGVKRYLHDKFLVINPQQINIDTHLSRLKNIKTLSKNTVCLFSQSTDQPQKYGILGLKGKRVTKVVEKPANLSGLSNQRILGVYILNSDFMDLMGNFNITEYLLEEALNKYASQGEVIAIRSDHPALSLKYAWDLFSIANYKFSQFPQTPKVHKKAWVHPTAIISGPVVIENGAKIYEYTLIQGPCYIGKNCLIGTGFITANRRLDRDNIRVLIKDRLVDVGTSFGSVIGDNVKIGIHCGTNPGTVIASNSLVLPMTLISHQK